MQVPGAVWLALLLAACSGEDLKVRGDPTYPIPMSVDPATSLSVTQAQIGTSAKDATPSFTLVIDTATPLSALWPTPGSDQADPHCQRIDPLRLLTGDGSKPRLAFEFASGFKYNCTPPGQVGLGAGTTLLGGVLGGDVLARFSVRFAHAGPSGEPTVQFFEDLFESSAQLAADGNVVLPVNVVGGGTLFGADGVQRHYPASLVGMRTCLAPMAFDDTGEEPLATPPAQAEKAATGAPMLLLLATGSPITVLSQASYQRLKASLAAEGRELVEEAPGPDETPLFMPGVTAKSSSVAERSPVPTPVQFFVDPGLLALVAHDVFGDGDPSIDACRELARARALTQYALRGGGAEVLPRHIAAHLELKPGRVAVVSDDAPFLVAARAASGTSTPVLDGYLGNDVLRQLDFELAYTAGGDEPSRVVLRCPSQAAVDPLAPPACLARARCTQDRAKAHECPTQPAGMTPPPG